MSWMGASTEPPVSPRALTTDEINRTWQEAVARNTTPNIDPYITICRTCDPNLCHTFHRAQTVEQRDRWQHEHTEQTGHTHYININQGLDEENT